MKLPKSFKDLTLSQFIQLHELNNNSALHPLDKDIKYLSILTGKTIDQVEELTPEEFKYLKLKLVAVTIPPDNIPVKDKIKVGSKTFYPTLSLVDMKVNQLVDFYSVFKQNDGDHIKSAHKLLAITFKTKSLFGKLKYDPNNHEKNSQMLLNANAEDCIGYVFFYLKLWKRCEPIIADYSERSRIEIENLMKEIQNDKKFQAFLKTGDGNTMLTNALKMIESRGMK